MPFVGRESFPDTTARPTAFVGKGLSTYDRATLYIGWRVPCASARTKPRRRNYSARFPNSPHRKSKYFTAFRGPGA
ncbi:protein of unknown function [Methylocaldum szegediense]|uniref:Uncharacterized protein n=1 Tax=Methylocaldum szegediense TaxID=73780 RepID=A0ABM9I407_9GAMM|nr:protein of unknown function [Methylocaldum szegediense]